ncbi:hypothetical protein QYE76_051069 [Lolium multiflorum]|uniref:Uncharacterized protein n=1 Tax=Lolium multiflorum TaxID=4521 RepID=A0AAD8SSP6_LOLMU|nr:hypothetical protein QYE76_051069 [Lolium multiflorum]
MSSSSHAMAPPVLSAVTAPAETIVVDNDAGRSEVVNPEYATWYVCHQTVLSGFFSTVMEEVLAHIMNASTARVAWLILKRMFSSRSRARVIQIRSQLTSVKKGVLVADNFPSMKTLTDTLAAIVQPLSEDEIISYVIAGLGPNYDSLVTSLSVKDDLTLDEVAVAAKGDTAATPEDAAAAMVAVAVDKANKARTLEGVAAAMVAVATAARDVAAEAAMAAHHARCARSATM